MKGEQRWQVGGSSRLWAWGAWWVWEHLVTRGEQGGVSRATVRTWASVLSGSGALQRQTEDCPWHRCVGDALKAECRAPGVEPEAPGPVQACGARVQVGEVLAAGRRWGEDRASGPEVTDVPVGTWPRGRVHRSRRCESGIGPCRCSTKSHRTGGAPRE